MRSALIASCLIAATALSAAAQERRPSQPVFRHVHEAKMLCGESRPHHASPLLTGHYATVVNIYNPYEASVTAVLNLRLAHPPGQLQAGEIVALDPVDVPPGRAVAVDCRTVKALSFPYGFPAKLIEGVLSVDALQPLVVTAVWTAAAPGQQGAGQQGAGAHHGAHSLSSLDVDHVPARAVETPPGDPGWDDDGAEQSFCDRLRRTSAAVTGLVVAQSYTFDEAPDEGPREVSRLDDVEVLAGAGGVVGGPVEIRLRRGFFPDGRFLDTSEMPVLTVGERYLLLLPNHGWVQEPVSLDEVFRIVTTGPREILVDQHGFALTDAEGGRSAEPVSTPEFLFRPPEMTGGPAPEEAISPQDFAAALIGADCPDEILTGPFTAYPLVPPTIGADQ
ncbi:MAG: hypothetical protein WD969_15165 [Paracoccaceae bacterium]